MKDKDISLYKYRSAIIPILLYQVVTKCIFFLGMAVYRQITGALLWNLDRPAFTSGDLPYLMRSWQGWVLILLGFVLLVFYTAFDINATIIIADRIFHNKPLKAMPILRESLAELKHFRNKTGIAVILYISIIAPLTIVVIGISFTSSFVIPEFIMSVINSVFVLRWLYRIVLFILNVVGFIHIFTFHAVILEELDVPAALKTSRQIMRGHWKHFVKAMLLFAIKGVLMILALVALIYGVPMTIISQLSLGTFAYHAAIIFFSFIMIIVVSLAGLLYLYFMMMKMTILYRRYRGMEKVPYQAPVKKHYPLFALLVGGITAAVLVASLVMAWDFEEFFPTISQTTVIAHRAGGNLANENTVLGVEAAYEHGVRNSEIDVQRTSDGHYIINHDDDFLRCCGDARTPGEMTLAEIKELQVANAFNPLEPPTEVSTMEEMLDAAKGKVTLYIELKGASADEQMVDDVYAMVKERDMVDDVRFISLNYHVLEYSKKKYPEITTGYLCYFAFGDVAKMNCDELLLEAETATEDNIFKIHEMGKKVNVWTVDSVDSMMHFLSSDADGIITDNIEDVENVRADLAQMGDTLRVLSGIVRMLG